uniref:Uncharacterized protein n=1 Tax=Arundo donax TaxID=35708 RepID=A0A0A9FI45_ARUDO
MCASLLLSDTITEAYDKHLK